MRARKFWLGAASSILFFGVAEARAESSLLRPLPWPYSHVTTVASDVDLQPAWYGRALHQRLNDQLGLQIADSFWVTAAIGASLSSSLFASVDQLNDTPSGIAGHSVFRLLLRDFSRGYYDHLHGWQNDALPQYRATLPEPLKLAGAPKRVDLPRVDFFATLWAGSKVQPMSFRLIFTSPPSADVVINLVDASGRAFSVPSDATRRGPSLQPEPNGEFILEIGLTGYKSPGLMTWRGQPSAVTIADPVGPTLVRIEWDNFSRTLVERQAPLLERFNLRPMFLSSHGGYTRAQNLGSREIYALSPFGTPEQVRNTNWSLRPQGDDPSSAAWHVDILKRLGVTSIAQIPPVDYPYTVRQKSRLEPLETAPFWRFDKTWGLGAWPPISRGDLEAKLRDVDPVAANAGVSQLLCTDNALCLRSEQGRTLGYSIATSLAHVAAGEGQIEHAWYQHLGTALSAPGTPPSNDLPFAPEVDRELKRLSDHAYNWSQSIEPAQRVWVPSPSAWQTYRISRNNLSQTINVDEKSSAVSINSVRDPVLNVDWPNARFPSRDLAFLTVYVPDAEKATVVLDGVAFDSFTRNPPDSTGRASVTLVNNAFPISILGYQPPDFTGDIVLSGFQSNETGLTLMATEKDPRFIYEPKELSFHNIGHLKLTARKEGRGAVWIRFTFAAGSRLVWSEDGAAPPDHDARLRLSFTNSPSQIASLAAMEVPRPLSPDADPPVFAGRVTKIEVGISDAELGTQLFIEDISALQSLSHGFAPDGSIVVSGRVLDRAGAPLADREVTFIGAERHLVRTDSAGYYDFFGVKRGQLARIRAKLNDGEVCAPMRGGQIWLGRDEVELDVAADQCR